MTIGCNIWMICLKLNWFFYDQSRMLQFSQFVWTPCYSVWDVFNNFLLIDATDRSKISSDQKRFFIALRLYPLSFFANTPFKLSFTLKYAFIFFSQRKKWFWNRRFYGCVLLLRKGTPGHHVPPLCRHEPPRFARQTVPPLTSKRGSITQHSFF